MKYISLLCFFLSMTTQGFSADSDGQMFDLEGLTINIGKEPVVDTKKWSLEHDTYTRRVINKPREGVVLDYKVAVFTDSKGRVESMEASTSGTPSGDKVDYYKSLNGFYMNNLIIKSEYLVTNVGNTIISKYLCDEIDKDSFWLQMKKGDDLKKLLFDIFIKQFSTLDTERKYIKNKNQEIDKSSYPENYKATFSLIENALKHGSEPFEKKIEPGSYLDHFIDANKALALFQKECRIMRAYSKDAEQENAKVEIKAQGNVQK